MTGGLDVRTGVIDFRPGSCATPCAHADVQAHETNNKITKRIRIFPFGAAVNPLPGRPRVKRVVCVLQNAPQYPPERPE